VARVTGAGYGINRAARRDAVGGGRTLLSAGLELSAEPLLKMGSTRPGTLRPTHLTAVSPKVLGSLGFGGDGLRLSFWPCFPRGRANPISLHCPRCSGSSTALIRSTWTAWESLTFPPSRQPCLRCLRSTRRINEVTRPSTFRTTSVNALGISGLLPVTLRCASGLGN
jgi:hypothetical protein